MKKILMMVIRIGLLLVMVIAGFLVAFPEWWDLRDFQRLDREQRAQDAANAKLTAENKTKREQQKQALFSRDHFPDANFLSCLLAQGKDSPERIVNLDCSNKNIADSTGISKLTNLTRLKISGNRLTSLNLAENVKLNDVYARNGLIEHVQLPHEFLVNVDLSGNQLSEFSLAGASRLKKLDVTDNKLTSLKLDESSVANLWAEDNQLSSIALTALANLRSLNLRNNDISSLDLAGMPRLTHVDLSENPLQQLEIAPRQNLKVLLLTDTQLATTQLEALREKVPTGNIISIDALSELIYPDPVFRRCVEAHLTDGIASVIEINCDRYQVGLLSRNAAIKSVDGLEHLFALREIDLTGHEITSLNLTRLPSLENLNIPRNNLKKLDVTQNSKLQSVRAASNFIEQVKLQDNDQLNTLFVSSNKLQSLDLSQTPNIKALQLNNNLLESLDASKALKLQRLLVDNNQLKSLAISSLSFPTQLSFKGNPLDSESINKLRQQFWSEYSDLPDDKVFSQKPKFPVFTLQADQFPDPLFKKCVENTLRSNDLTALDDILRLDCSYQDIVDLNGLQLLTGLEHLVLQGIDAKQVPLFNHPSLNNILITELPLESLDLSELTALKTITLSRNSSLGELKLPENHSIERITASFNALRALQVPDSESLKWLELKNNQLQQINLGQLKKLNSLDVSDNKLEKINVRSLSSLKNLTVAKNKLTEIDLSGNPEIQELFIAFNQIESLDLTSSKQLSELLLFNNPLKVPDLTHLSQLKTIAIDKTQLDELGAKRMQLGFTEEAKISDSVIVLSKK